MLRTLRSRMMTAFASAAVAFATIHPQPLAAQATTRVKIENNSDYAIYAIYLSPVNSNFWGRDLLGFDQVLEPGYTVTLPRSDIGDYDLMLVDEDLDSCVVHNVRVNSGTDWSIDNSWLLHCEFHR
jgi:hypothetical protein